MNFNEAIKAGILKVLSISKKNLIFGLEVTNIGAGFADKYKKQVFETPVSELATAGMVVGLATRGYKPQIVFGRVEFAMLAFDQIFTQAGRWEYSFGGNYKCPASFRIQVGRQWGNGPQHTANYHSIFLQAYGIDIFIPSTPKEAYEQIIYMNKVDHPTVMLEHKYLSQVRQNFILRKNIQKPKSATIYYDNKASDMLVVTYADTLIDALKAQKELKKININVAIINLSYFPSKKRIDKNVITFAKKFKNLLFFDSAPKEFGIMAGVASILMEELKSTKKIHFLSPPNNPSPSAPSLAKKYYKNYQDLHYMICKILHKKTKKLKKLSFDQIMLWPKDDIDDLM